MTTRPLARFAAEVARELAATPRRFRYLLSLLAGMLGALIFLLITGLQW